MSEIKPILWMSDQGIPYKAESDARQNSWNNSHPLYDQSSIDLLVQNIERLTAERDAAVADANRYRWLREHNNYPDTDDVDSFWSDILGECCDGQSFDYAIDAAMKEQEQDKQ